LTASVELGYCAVKIRDTQADSAGCLEQGIAMLVSSLVQVSYCS
jgi:hypothetical protein